MVTTIQFVSEGVSDRDGGGIGENDSGAVFDGHNTRRRFASMPPYGQSSGPPPRFMHRRRPAATGPAHGRRGPRGSHGGEIEGFLRAAPSDCPDRGPDWVTFSPAFCGSVVINLLWAGGMPSSAASCLPQRHLSGGHANFAFVEPEREYGPAPFGRHSACTIC
jgi:hypothetical protein